MFGHTFNGRAIMFFVVQSFVAVLICFAYDIFSLFA